MKGLACAFLVTNSKEAKTYARFFKKIQDASKGKWQPQTIMADFEASIHNGILMAFGDKTKARKCWFHLTQAVRRHTHAAGK